MPTVSPRRAHVHLPHPAGLPLLAAVERAGHRRDVPATRSSEHSRRYAQDYPYYAPDIVGLHAYAQPSTRTRPAHISGIRARGMTLSITLAKPAGDFLAAPCDAALLPGAALDAARPEARDRDRSPATARTTSPRSTRDRIVLLRNPNYGGKPPPPGGADRDHRRRPDAEGGRARRQRTARLPAERLRRRNVAARPAGELAGATAPAAPPPARAGSASSYTRSRCSTRSSSTRGGRSSGTAPPAGGRVRARPAGDGESVLRHPAPSESSRLPGYGAGHVYPLSRPDLRNGAPAGRPEATRRPCC